MLEGTGALATKYSLGKDPEGMIDSLNIWSTSFWILGRVKRRQIFEAMAQQYGF